MAKKIEEKYRELSEIDHVKLRPGMWVGSTKEEERQFYVYNIDTGKLEQKYLMYVPAMLKIVDEVISNSCDEYRRKDNLGLTELSVTMIPKENRIIVRDNGGIPVVKHKEAGCYVPEFIFGRLRTSSNYDDSEDRNVIGTNGVGSSIANIFSSKFKVTTADKKNKITVEWKDGMSECINHGKPEKSKEHFTETDFNIDVNAFGCHDINMDFIDIIHKRCIDAAASNPGLKVTFICNDYKEEWKFKSFDEYIDLYSNYLNIKDKITFKNDLCTAIVFPDSNVDIGFVNGAECSRGTHIRVFRSSINSAVAEWLEKKDKMKDLSPRSVENKYSVFMNIDVSNPAYSSQTKEELTTPVDSFSKNENKKWNVPNKFINDILKSEIINLMRDWYKNRQAAEDEKTLRKLNKEASKGLKRSDKYIPANTKKKHERELWIYEGDSAARGFRTGRNPLTQAAYLMRGVPPNALNMSAIQIMKNDVYNDLVTILGLKFGSEFDIKNLNFGKIVISTDADVDGDKIAALLLVFFKNWPQLIEKKIVCRSISPIIIAKKGKDRRKYYSIEDFNKEEKKLKGYMIKYAKGLSGLDAEETKEMMRNPIYLNFEYDERADEMFERWFGTDSDQRKKLMEL
ncbi:MAG: hypothetical protein J6D03_00515 [Clostridia bacterium]|nr:hypothetical protein [Clostridia bacterium]